MLPDTVSEITHDAGGVIYNSTSKPLIVKAFDQSSPSAQGLPSSEFTRRFTLPTFVDLGKVNGGFNDATLCATLPKSEESIPKQAEVNRRAKRRGSIRLKRCATNNLRMNHPLEEKAPQRLRKGARRGGPEEVNQWICPFPQNNSSTSSRFTIWRSGPHSFSPMRPSI